MYNKKSFLSELKQKFQEDLPGNKAHDRVVSYNRISPAEAIQSGKNPKQSAVLVLLFQKEKNWHFVLTRRKEYPGVHSKQISLPGGKIEAVDLNLKHTAIRETQEEIGVESSSIQILGKLTSLYIPPSNFIVQPYVGFVDYKPVFIPEEKEVEEIILTPISKLWEENVIKKTRVSVGTNMKIEVPFFDIQNHVVWGATAMVLSEFREVCK